MIKSIIFLIILFSLVHSIRKVHVGKNAHPRQTSQELTIGGVWPLTNLGTGVGHEPAFNLAIQDLTSNEEFWPSSWKLKGVWKDSACDPATGVGSVIEIMKENPDFVGLIGPDCSGVSVRVAKLAQYYSFPLVSPISTSPSLSDKEQYPLFSRVVTSDTEQARIWFSLMEHYSWRSVAILHSEEEVMKLAVEAFLELSQDSGYNSYTQSFISGKFNETLLQNILDVGYTIIILATYAPDASVVFKLASKVGMTSEGYSWMGTDGWQYAEFWNTDDEPDLVREAAQGSIGGSFILGEGDQYDRLVNYVVDSGSSVNLETGYVYDATTAMGRALGAILKDSSFSGSIEDIDGAYFTQLIREQDFQGVTGRVAFDENGDRKYMQMIIQNLVGEEWKQIGLWSGTELSITEEAVFPGDTTKVPTDETTVTLRILGLFPWSGNWPVGSLVQPGFEIAIKHSKDDMPAGWSIEGYVNDTMCDPGTGMAQIVEAHDTYDVLGIIGPGCPDVSIPCALLTPAWSIPMVSWGTTAPSLSDPEVYPTFYRVVHTDTIMAQSWLAFCKHFGWTSVSVLFSTDEYPQKIAETFVSLAEEAGIKTYTESFISGPELNPIRQLTDLKKRSTIFFLSADQDDATIVFKVASELGMTTDRYAWFGTDAWQVRGWEDSTGNSSLVSNAGFGSLGVGLPYGEGEEYQSFLKELEQDYGIKESHINTAYAYDATRALVTVILNMISKNKNPRDRKLLLEEMNKGIEFDGITGRVIMDTNGERRSIDFVIRNYLNGVWEEIGYARQDGDNLIFEFDLDPVFPGNTTHVPDGVPQQTDFDISWTVRYVFIAITISLIVVLLIITILFIIKKDEKSIKLSSVSLGLATLFGLLMYYICVFLLSPEPSDSSCLAYIWVLKLAFCVTFGCLFVKTLKLYRVYTSPESSLEEPALFGILFVIVACGVIYLSIWTAIDPYKLQYETDPTDETVRWLVCKSDDDAWKWVAFGLECFFMIFGAILAWKVRNLPTQANESHSVAYSMYNMFIVQVVMFSVVDSTDADPNVTFALEAVTVLAIATGVLAIVFGTKLFLVFFPSNSTSGTSTFGSNFNKSKMSSINN